MNRRGSFLLNWFFYSGIVGVGIVVIKCLSFLLSRATPEALAVVGVLIIGAICAFMDRKPSK